MVIDFCRILKKKLAEERQTLLERMGTGVEADKYRELVGRTRQLADMIIMIDEERGKFMNEENDDGRGKGGDR